jgi:hypothetical protein
MLGYMTVLADNKLLYGRHYPNGTMAVEYMYGPEGTWGKLDTMQYTYNYYEQYGSAAHPYNRDALIREAQTVPHTCRDANGHLLHDKDGKEQDIVHPVPAGSCAFCEHTGKGSNGHRGQPFYNFWYDDNCLARNVSRAYGKPEPSGLYPYSNFIRWSVVGDSLATYKPYGSDFIDCLALDGIYFYRAGDFEAAFRKWQRILEVTQPTYDGANQRFVYKIRDIYHYGLAAVLAAAMMDCGHLSDGKRDNALQHYVSLRSQILSKQINEGGVLKGWTSGDNPTDLVNSETISTSVLGLATGADLVFEAGKPPLTYSQESNFFVRPHNVISAVFEGGSKPGYLSNGPNWQCAGGHNYAVEFVVRAPYPKTCAAEVSVYDTTHQKLLATNRVEFREAIPGMNWTKARLTFTLPATAALSLRCYWLGGSSQASNMDLAFVRVKAAP